LWHPTRKNLMFSVQNGSVWQSSDEGMSWEKVLASKLEDETVAELHWASGYDKLYAIGFARGIFVHDLVVQSASYGGSVGLAKEEER